MKPLLLRRLLALIVHAQDLTQQSKRVAISRALAATNAPLDFLQLRFTVGDATTLDALLDTKRRLQELLATAAAVSATPGGADDDAHGSRRLPGKHPAALIVNASLDDIIALTRRKDQCAPLDGWHVKERDLFRDDLPQMIHHARARSDEQTTIVGCSVHSVAAAVHAARLGVDYIQVGTMFSTPSHPEKASVDQLEGPQLLQAILSEGRALRNELSMPPLIAVGGINTPQQIRQVVSAGASGVAVIRGILAADDARVTAAQYRAVLDEDHAAANSQAVATEQPQ